MPDSREWLEWEGESFPLPDSTSPHAVRWAKLLVALIAPHVRLFTDPTGHTEWAWEGDEVLLEKVTQHIMDEAINRALTNVERTVVKEFR